MGDGIDVHGHGVPSALIEEARRAGERFGGVTVEQDGDAIVVTFPGEKPLRPVPRDMSDVSKRCEWLRQNGLAKQLVSPWVDIQGVNMDPSAGRQWAAMVNEKMAEWCEAAGDMLAPLATLHLADSTSAAEELQRAAEELGCVGAMLQTHHRYGTLNVEGWEALWEVSEALELPIVLHPPMSGPTKLDGDQQGLGFRALWGRPMDTTVLAASLLLEKLFDRYPRVRVVLVHGGGYLPYQANRIDGEVARGRTGSSLGEELPSSQVGKFYFDTTLMSAAAIKMLVESYGADHVVLGSDYPLFAKIVAPCSELEGARIDGRARDMVSWESAERLFPRLRGNVRQ